MSDIDCPFDGDFCEKKQKRVDEWRERCLRNPQPYYTNASCQSMFSDCPLKCTEERYEICARYHRYCNIVDKVMNGVNQSLAQMIKSKTISVDGKKFEQISDETDCAVRAFANLVKQIIKKTQEYDRN